MAGVARRFFHSYLNETKKQPQSILKSIMLTLWRLDQKLFRVILCALRHPVQPLKKAESFIISAIQYFCRQATLLKY